MRTKETYIAVASLAGIAIALITRTDWPLFAVLAASVPLLYDIVRKLAAREVGADALAAISIVTSIVLHEYLAGAIIVLMLSGGTALELHATRRASAVLAALAKRVPHFARRVTESGFVEVATQD